MIHTFDTCRGYKTETGWTRRLPDEMWVCAKCTLPHARYLESFMAGKAKETGVATYLNLLRYGPLHNKLLSNAEFLNRRQLSARDDAEEILAHAEEYRWTPEVIYGSESGAAARVWVWKEHVEA